MLKECLAGVPNAVRENSVSVSEYMKGIASLVKQITVQLLNLAQQNSTQLSTICLG